MRLQRRAVHAPPIDPHRGAGGGRGPCHSRPRPRAAQRRHRARGARGAEAV